MRNLHCSSDSGAAGLSTRTLACTSQQARINGAVNSGSPRAIKPGVSTRVTTMPINGSQGRRRCWLSARAASTGL